MVAKTSAGFRDLLLVALIVCAASTASAFNSGDRVQCNATNVNVRSSPTTTATIVGQVSSPTRGTIQSGPYSGSGFTWYYVNWDTGINGYTVQDYYQLATAPAPSLSSISPNPVTGSSSARTFTLSGSNFVSGAKVQVAYASNGYTFVNTNTNPTFVSSTQLTVPITTSTTADTWKVRVQNPDGQLSGQINLVVNAPAANPPTLNSISPNPVTGSTNAQTFTLSGSNFVSGAKVQVAYASNGYTFVNTNTNATFVSSTELTVPITTSTTADTWKVRVQNPDGQLSGQINLVVNAPAANPPTLNSISPNPVTGSTSAQTFTLSGSNFVAGAKVQVAYASNGYTFVNTNTNATFVSSTQLTVPITTSTTADTWKVRVQNPDGQLSGQINLVVNAPATQSPPGATTNLASNVTATSAQFNATIDPKGAPTTAYFEWGTTTAYGNSTPAGNFGTMPQAVGYNQTGLSSGVTYHFRIVATNSAGTTRGLDSSFTALTSTPSTPSITSVSPNPVIGATTSQRFTINGANFTPSSVVNLRNLTTGMPYLNRTVGSQTASRLVINPNFGTEAHTWSVEVVNGSLSSGQYQFQVQSPVAAPRPDLMPSNVQISPTAVQIGNPVAVTVTVSNLGPADAVPSTTRVRINTSTSSTSSADIALGDIATPAIAAGSAKTISGSFSLPAGVTVGTNYIWISVDNNKVTNESDGTNDYARSPTVSVTGAPTAKPVIQSLTGDQTVNQGQAAVYSVVATGQGSLTYQWRRNGTAITNSTKSSITTGLGGTYSVDVSNGGGTTRSSGTTLTVIPDSTIPPPIAAGGSLTTFQAFDPAWPTVVITHGWQQDGDYSTIYPPVTWQSEMAQAIKDRMPSGYVNVLMFAWPEAYTHSHNPLPAERAIASEGSQLANALQTRLGLAYEQKIHFVGHSFGSLLNAYAVSKVRYHVDQVSILDAPTNLKVGAKSWPRVSDTLFQDLLPRARVDYVDNYIADTETTLCIWQYFGVCLGGTVGDSVAGAAPDGGMHLGTDHEGTHFFYLNSIRSLSSLLGFNCSALLSSKQQLDRWNPPVAISRAVSTFTDVASAKLGAVSSDIDNVSGALQPVLRLQNTASARLAGWGPKSADDVSLTDSSIEFEITVPAEAQNLHFNFFFPELGDGDWLSVSFNDNILYTFMGTSFFGTQYDDAVIRVSDFAGQTGLVRIVLHSASSTAAEVRLANVRFETTFVGASAFGNISTRLSVGAGDNAMIGGFIITGTQPKTVVVRGIGPSLAEFGVQGALEDPVIEVYDSDGVLRGTNDNWNDAETKQQIIDSGLAPTNSLESALWGTINPGAYTVVVRGKNNGTGIGLFEVYDLDQTVDSKLANISTRGFVDTGDNVMIGGTIVVGTSPTKVLVRAIGPSLSNFGLPNALQDPTLELHDSNGVLTGANNDWRTDQEADIAATTIPPADDRESAILATLAPGAYTAVVRGAGNSTGVGLVEAYQLSTPTPTPSPTPTATPIPTPTPVPTPVVVFADNFDDNVIDPAKWGTSGYAVSEQGAIMRVETNVTDTGGVLLSTPFMIQPNGEITMKRKTYVHRGGYVYMATLRLFIGNLPPVGVHYCDINWNDTIGDTTYIQRHGIHLSRNNANPHIAAYNADVSDVISPIWDQWFDEEIGYNPATGVLSYFINGTKQMDYFVGVMPDTSATQMSMRLDSWGWFTGHTHWMDDLTVSQ